MNRRKFVSSVAAAGAVAALPSRVFGATTPTLKVGLIGCGWWAGMSLNAFYAQGSIEVVSLCDPNSKALEKTLKAVKEKQDAEAETYSDYRDMLSSKKHDIVIVTTPDHWHALPAIAAMKAGADVFLEKPIGVDVIEGEALVAAARKYGSVVQVNLQRRSMSLYQEAKERYIDSGKIGKIGLAECFFYGGAGDKEVFENVAVPDHLDYEFWTGPAPKIPFVAPLETRKWRQFMEYGNGTIGDMGVHVFDHIRQMLDIDWPKKVSSTGGLFIFKDKSPNISDTQTTVFHYPDLNVSWEHRPWGKSPIPYRHWTDNWGAKIIGTKGTLSLSALGYSFEANSGSPAEGRHLCSKSNDLENVDFESIGAAWDAIDQAHVKNFLDARKTRSKPSADVEEGHISSACCILGNMALDLGRPLSYDPASRTIPGDEEATRLLARPYRAPWNHPDPESV
ncbi:Oxidoreductase family, NAD-binding Rossmann fold protein [Verrucomicrobiia bacterium DG1235]|nr:Oxidoreductase family, NAD-binding Rossmann fold protein [Verrucomicrobiae bacterium DG1235]